MFDIQGAQSCAETLFYVVGVAAAGLSAFEYRKNSRLERTRWLFELYQRFYGDKSEIKKTWKRLDEERLSPIQRDDLLNFFEFIAILRSRKELAPAEIEDMFAYPLKRLAADDSLLGYLERYDYEHLHALLRAGLHSAW